MLKIKKIFFILMLISLLSACQTEHTTIDPTNLHQLESLNQGDTPLPSPEPVPKPNAYGGGGIRSKALADAALTLGAQGGLAWASKQINHRVQEDKWNLETIYNFNAMMLSHGVLPPVLAQGDNSLNLADPNTIRIADRTYKIISQARFVTTPPNWRDYLWMSYPTPELPNQVLFPRTAGEQAIWKKAIHLGWEKGIEQAFNIYRQSLNRLKRDYAGMILYRKLLQSHMVSPPFVAKTELGVTGNGTDMRINDQVLRIVELPKLQTDSRTWNAIVVKS